MCSKIVCQHWSGIPSSLPEESPLTPRMPWSPLFYCLWRFVQIGHFHKGHRRVVNSRVWLLSFAQCVPRIQFQQVSAFCCFWLSMLCCMDRLFVTRWLMLLRTLVGSFVWPCVFILSRVSTRAGVSGPHSVCRILGPPAPLPPRLFILGILSSGISGHVKFAFRWQLMMLNIF